ncbi:MAG: DUF3825 domain-containing protein [Treponema sp.]|jgi:hypothetical protein|nr:DUF3825 domain-containing protein [Treponema sp.]
MNNAEMLEKTMQILDSRKNKEGWTDLAPVGNLLIGAGINYRAEGFPKLKDFLESFPENIEIKADTTSFKMPIYYARSRGVASRQNQSIRYLRQWTYIDFRNSVNALKEIAAPERWYYKTQDPDYPYPILAKYLNYTFFRLLQEANKLCVSEHYAAFNTGLVNKIYEPIYALFEKNHVPGYQEWEFLGFCMSGVDRLGKLLASNFNPLPQRAHYFKNPAELIYDVKAPEPQLDWDHIILDNIARFPRDFIEENKPANFVLQDTSSMSMPEKAEYYSHLASAIESDSKKFRTITNRLKDSLYLSLKRIEWNYKTAIPMYFPTRNSMSLLLPLSLLDDDVINLALVTELTPAGNYLGHTILSLDMAYSNARLITRPDSDWLVAEKIDTTKDGEDD